MKTYKGWTITFDARRPVTGQWRADRFGVGLCGNSEEAIKRMVDRKISESNNPPSWRKE